MDDIAIRVESLSKQYRISGPQPRYRTLRDSLAQAVQSPWRRVASVVEGRPPAAADQTIWALKDVSFEVRQGEVLGIIGRNGAGKSTLLKILSRITEPTEGHAEIHGRVGSLLEVGTGFHQELTGRENIYLNGAILGMKKAEIDRKFDEIVEFSGVSKFLNTPVKHYSSGMRVRLAFSVAAHLDPEVLLIDEVLAVGDAAFQKKCLGKMGEVARGGRTVLFVSHNMGAVENLCRRGLVLDQGRIAYIGSQRGAVAEYTKSLSVNGVGLRGRTDRRGSGEIQIVKVEFRGTDGNALDVVPCGHGVEIYLHFEAAPHRRGDHVVVSVKLKTPLGTPVFLLHNRMTGDMFGELPGRGAFVCRIPQLPLPASTYYVDYAVISGGVWLDGLTEAAELTVVEGDFFGSGEVPPISHGVCLVKGRWRLESALDASG